MMRRIKKSTPLPQDYDLLTVDTPHDTLQAPYSYGPKSAVFYHYPIYLRRGPPRYTLFSLID
jgi:hypothetical protein